MNAALASLADFIAAQTAAGAKGAWTKGPTVPYRGTSGVPLAQYIGWLREVEASPGLAGETVKTTVQRMRRLYYSKFTADFKGETATKADKIMTEVTPANAPPLSTDHIGLVALNGLFGTSSIRTARGLDVDIAHLWMVADWQVNGGSLYGWGANIYVDSKISALFSWAGDLGSAVRTFRDHERIRMSGNVPTTASKKQVLLDAVALLASKDDLLGDLDAVVLASRWESLGSNFVLSGELENYYKDDDTPQAQARLLAYPNSARRFHYFLKAAEPTIPVNGRDSEPPDVTLQDAEATAVIAEAMVDGTADTWKKSVGEVNRKLDDRGRAEFNSLVGKFVEFLKLGLRDGDAPWPPSSL